MVEEKNMDLKKAQTDMEIRAELDFLVDEYSKRATLVEQDKEAIRIMEKEGKNPRDSFRVVGIRDREGEKSELQIVTSGEEGYKKAKETLSVLKERKRVSVVNETSERYEKDSPKMLDTLKDWMLRKCESELAYAREKGRESEVKELEERIERVKRKW